MGLREAYVGALRGSILAGGAAAQVAPGDWWPITIVAVVLGGGEVGGVLRFGAATAIRAAAGAYASDPLWASLIAGTMRLYQGGTADLSAPLRAAGGSILALTKNPQFGTLRGAVVQPAPQVTAAEIAPPPAVPASVAVAPPLLVLGPVPGSGAAGSSSRPPGPPAQAVARSSMSADEWARIYGAPTVVVEYPPADLPAYSGPTTDEFYKAYTSPDQVLLGGLGAIPGAPGYIPVFTQLGPEVDLSKVAGLSRSELQQAAAGAGVVALGQAQGLDPATIPTQTLRQILPVASALLQAQVDREGLIGGLAAPDKWGPQTRELARLQRAADAGQDTPLLRQQARSLVSSLGGVLVGTPANLRSDSGDSAAQSRTLGQELADQAGQVAAQGLSAAGQVAAQSLSAAGQVAAVGAGVLALGLLAGLLVRR